MSQQPRATLVLSPDDPSNTTIYDAADGTEVYTVSTQRRWNGTTTYIVNVHGAVVAALQERYLVSDRLILGRDPPMPLHEWLRINMANISVNMNASFKDESGRKYKWKGNVVGHRGALELFTKDDEYTEPIARFDRSHPQGVSGAQSGSSTEHQHRPRPATLSLTLRALEIRDSVVTSLLVLEKQRRKDRQALQASPEDPTEVYRWGS
ncbi:hypothetical protein BD310DRAFT_842774 [Dichomitus squalens]|uniref:DUF6593 domain-containing protein n=1 Tax=Dichomitus squalens TaxID=114155 RepID=A0A4Q9Q7X4_9APHY|nr:hypothetical protein BD310DRAFT_842774 [Dichomitus squalens]